MKCNDCNRTMTVDTASGEAYCGPCNKMTMIDISSFQGRVRDRDDILLAHIDTGAPRQGLEMLGRRRINAVPAAVYNLGDYDNEDEDEDEYADDDWPDEYDEDAEDMG